MIMLLFSKKDLMCNGYFVNQQKGYHTIKKKKKFFFSGKVRPRLILINYYILKKLINY